MGLLFADNGGKGDFKTKAEAEWLKELGCKACTLNTNKGKIEAYGPADAEIYVLGEFATRPDQDNNRPYSGSAGDLMRSLMPRDAPREIRWNTALNCHPTGNRAPTPHELSCCRSRIEADILRTRPKVIWGFGEIPLKWISGFNGIAYWRGRRMPVKVGDHVCWYYAFFDHRYLNRSARNDTGRFRSEDERITSFDLKRAWAEIDELPKPLVHNAEMARRNVECVTEIGDISKALQWASRQPSIGLDYETNRKRPYYAGAKILTGAVGTIDQAFAFPFEHPGAGYGPREIKEIKELWKRFLMGASCVKAVHQLAFELEWSGWFFGKEVIRARKWADTSNAAAVLDERTGKKQKSGPFSLEFLIQMLYGFSIKGVSNVDRKNLESTRLETVLLYNGIDSKYHHGLWEELQTRIKDEGLEEVYRLAYRRVPTVVLSQLKGVPVDQAMVKDLQKKYGGLLKEAEQAIHTLPVIKRFTGQRGREFNPNSPKDLPFVLNDMLKCKEVNVTDKFTKVTKVSTDESVLEEIIKNYEPDSEPVVLAKSVIQLREVAGTKSKYIDALSPTSENSVIFPDGLLHTNFNTYFAETGRLSSDEPNLQNFPKRNKDTKEVRKSIAARANEIILSIDYGQIEARVIAMITKDPVFCKALWERFDVHQDWAERVAYAYPSRIGGKKFLKDKKVMKEFRGDIKNEWTFPLFFGAKDASVAAYLHIPVEVLKPLIREFWKMFAGVKTWQEDLLVSYQRLGYVECLTGRRRRGPLSLNQVINTPVQGTAAEIVLDAMSRLSEMEDDEVQPEINIHDDLTFLRVPVKRVDDIAERVINEMLNVPFKWVNVPITAEMSVGKNWCDLEEVATYSSDTWGK